MSFKVIDSSLCVTVPFSVFRHKAFLRPFRMTIEGRVTMMGNVKRPRVSASEDLLPW